MSAPRLFRSGAVREAAPVQHVHLGLGNFFRAHEAWYTERSPDAAECGIAAFGGRTGLLAEALSQQEGLYTLITRGPDRDRVEVIASISRAYSAADHEAWLGCLASPDVRVVTLTVTEAGYCRDAGGDLDLGDPAVSADLAALRTDLTTAVHTAPGRLVAGLAARWRAGGGPISVVPCDNVADNGEMTRDVLRTAARAVGRELSAWVDESVSVATTMVDRITPRATEADSAGVLAATGWRDTAPVVTEPFSEWVLSGAFPAGRPAWHEAGATFVDDVRPFEQRKLWLLNGGHSLLAYLGSARGHVTVAEAVADDMCRGWLERWWSEAGPLLGQPAADVATYTEALILRFSNPRMQHRLDQIAADGSQKLPVRVLPALRAERASGRLPVGAVCVLAAWLVHLRRAGEAAGAGAGAGYAVNDVRADLLVPLAVRPMTEAAQRVLGALDPELADDGDLVAAVASAARGIEAARQP